MVTDENLASLDLNTTIEVIGQAYWKSCDSMAIFCILTFTSTNLNLVIVNHTIHIVAILVEIKINFPILFKFAIVV